MTTPAKIETALESTIRKTRGAFFTPREISQFVAKWAIRSKSDLVLEPSCGEASFLLAAGERLRTLSHLADDPIGLTGIEIDEPTAGRAASLLIDAGFACDIKTADFFDIPSRPLYDAVIGNPPYVRYQDFSGHSRAKGLETALAQGIRFNLLTNSWAPFVIHASQFVKPNGRLGLVLPAELLSVKYAAQVRRFLLDKFESIKLVMFDELVFPGVLEEVVLLLAEGTGPTNGFHLYQARNLEDLESPIRRGWKQFTPTSVEKWTPALVGSTAMEAYERCTAQFETLIDWGETYLGTVTGNNRFFTLSAKQVSDLKLTTDDIVPISPPGSRHLRGMSFTERAWSELRMEQSRCHLFYPSLESPSHAAVRYIEQGEQLGVPKAYKCKVRKPWWRVPLVPMPDLFLTYMDHESPRLVTNEADLFHLNSLYGVRLKAERCQLGRALLPLGSMNSLTVLGAEIVGRSYGGGILKVEPNEADLLPLPTLSLIEKASNDLRSLSPYVGIYLRQRDLAAVIKAVDSILLKKYLGFSSSDLKRLRSAREALFVRRTTRGRRA